VIKASEKTTIEESLSALINQIDVDMLLVFHEQRNFWKALFEKSLSSEMVYEWSKPVLTMHKKKA
jgi:hypothetical protein